VLDVIIDVFIANVTDNWEFFVRFFEQSPWKPKIVTKKIKRGGGNDVEIEERDGNYVLGQIMGFKFDYYNSGHGLNNPSTPMQLTLVAAILIKHKLIR
jgi:THO complex subunit 2